MYKKNVKTNHVIALIKRKHRSPEDDQVDATFLALVSHSVNLGFFKSGFHPFRKRERAMRQQLRQA
jgi:hypothetical protein